MSAEQFPHCKLPFLRDIYEPSEDLHKQIASVRFHSLIRKWVKRAEILPKICDALPHLFQRNFMLPPDRVEHMGFHKVDERELRLRWVGNQDDRLEKLLPGFDRVVSP